MTTKQSIDAEVVIPVRWDAVDAAAEHELTVHQSRLARYCDVTVVDGSAGPCADARRIRWAEHVRVLRPDERWGPGNGTVVGALTGVAAARHERVVIADHDVRYDRPRLRAVVAALHDADLVLPQDYPTGYPWWAWWESGRMLLNRAFAADWPGTCAVRRSSILAMRGWSAAALYENLEMARRVAAAGGRVVHRPDLFVARRPPALQHSVRQRVRQAYEDQVQPVRLALGLAVLPRDRPAPATPSHALRGRRHGRGGRGDGPPPGRRPEGLPAHTSLAAPLWALERGACAWLALGVRARGGPVHHGHRTPLAGHSPQWHSCHLDAGRLFDRREWLARPGTGDLTSAWGQAGTRQPSPGVVQLRSASERRALRDVEGPPRESCVNVGRAALGQEPLNRTSLFLIACQRQMAVRRSSALGRHEDQSERPAHLSL